jgi:hypothetical protein
MSSKIICPHCGHELEIDYNMTKTIDDTHMIPVAASTLRRYKGPLYATAITIILIGCYYIIM